MARSATSCGPNSSGCTAGWGNRTLPFHKETDLRSLAEVRSRWETVDAERERSSPG